MCMYYDVILLLQAAVRYTQFGLPTISALCHIDDVGPIPPDPVSDVKITFLQVVPQTNGSLNGQVSRVVVTLRYNWSTPAFQGEGITGYEVWLERRPAPDGQLTQLLHLLGPQATDDELQAMFSESDTNFTLYFQVSNQASLNLRHFFGCSAAMLAITYI